MGDGVGGIGTGQHFTFAEAQALHEDESTSAIVRRDAKIGIDIHGTDPSHSAVKRAQQESWADAASVGEATFDGLGLVEIPFAGAAECAATVASPVIGLALGAYSLYRAHADGDEQNAAIHRQDAHAALVSTLDLPEAYRSQRLDIDLNAVPKSWKSPAFKMAEGIRADPKGLAQLQLHCDRGMNAARDACRANVSAKDYLAANPKVADAYAKDAAFHEGFDAYFHTAEVGRESAARLDRALDQRDGWYAQAHIAVRV
jgi:hypothetical protein